jgi:hypothetical protein
MRASVAKLRPTARRSFAVSHRDRAIREDAVPVVFATAEPFGQPLAKCGSHRSRLRRAGATVDPAILALHVYYWTEIFQMNGWKLYHRYKKHLPAARRREVDQLCEQVALGAEPGEIERTVSTILTAVWSDDNWDAAIRGHRVG